MHPSRRVFTIPVLVVLLLALAGCGSGGPNAPTLTSKVWELASASGDSPGELTEIPHPELYTIEFKSDGTFAAKADCNQVAGTYSAPGGGKLTITPGPSTMAACAAGSLSDRFVTGLSGTTSYTITDRQLALSTTDGRTMTFD